MVKRLLIFSLTALLLWLTPIAMDAAPVYVAGIMEMAPEQDIEISYNNGELSVIGAEGCKLEIVSLTGNKVLIMEIDSPAQKIELNIPKGCYIVKVGKVVRKVSVR